MWSIFAVEAALRPRLGAGGRAQLSRLIKRAREQGLVSEQLADTVNTGRELRNRFVHGSEQPIWSFGMAAQVIGASFKIVTELYP